MALSSKTYKTNINLTAAPLNFDLQRRANSHNSVQNFPQTAQGSSHPFFTTPRLSSENVTQNSAILHQALANLSPHTITSYLDRMTQKGYKNLKHTNNMASLLKTGSKESRESSSRSAKKKENSSDIKYLEEFTSSHSRPINEPADYEERVKNDF